MLWESVISIEHKINIYVDKMICIRCTCTCILELVAYLVQIINWGSGSFFDLDGDVQHILQVYSTDKNNGEFVHVAFLTSMLIDKIFTFLQSTNCILLKVYCFFLNHGQGLLYIFLTERISLQK